MMMMMHALFGLRIGYEHDALLDFQGFVRVIHDYLVQGGPAETGEAASKAAKG